jgi:hypothetical protein
MGVIDDVEADQRITGPPCRLRRYLNSLPPDEAAEYRRLLWAPAYAHIRHTTIARHLRARGQQITDGAVGRHRNLECVNCLSDVAAYQAVK